MTGQWDTIIIRGTGTQIQYNCVTPNRTLLLDNFLDYFMHMCRPFELYAHLLVLESMDYYSHIGIQLERLGFDCEWN